ncbi:MAG TPA: prepilin-type N-terminal cleavage/methylation domain-containing protein [Candidatus Saccharimonadales bacterium]|nr:prepilin-type N-terminal cleavage/methylation domain-containing protein [Candidatus Saccharimonadales bacterium]
MNSLKKVTQKGFTIVELLIVIVVIGILAALVITTYNGIQQKGRNTERQTDAKSVQGQLEAYYAQNGKYPTLAQLNDVADGGFVKTKLKGMDLEALRDPKAAAGTYVVNATADPDNYGYTATADVSGEIIAYILEYQEEGETGVTQVKSLN